MRGEPESEVATGNGGQGRPAEPAPVRDVRQVVGDLAGSTWTLAALAFALETGLADVIGTPTTAAAVASHIGVPAPLVDAVLEVLCTTGLVRREGQAFLAEPGLVGCLEGLPRELLHAEIRSHQLQTFDLVESGRRGGVRLGWSHGDPEILQAQGTRSKAVVEAYVSHVFPKLQGLFATLEGPCPSFLDVGSGVAEIAIEMCRRFPRLRAVGLDPLEAAQALAEDNVRRAGLEGRIKLSRGRVEELDEDGLFDLAQMPIFFLPDDVMTKGLARVRKALTPCGWVVLQIAGVPGAKLPPVLRLMFVTYGSEVHSPERAADMLTEAGYEDVTVFPPLPGTPVSYVAGRRAGKSRVDRGN